MLRTERFGLVLSPTEKEAVIRLAELEGGLSRAALVRSLIRRAASEQGLWPPKKGCGKRLSHQKAGQDDRQVMNSYLKGERQ